VGREDIAGGSAASRAGAGAGAEGVEVEFGDPSRTKRVLREHSRLLEYSSWGRLWRVVGREGAARCPPWGSTQASCRGSNSTADVSTFLCVLHVTTRPFARVSTAYAGAPCPVRAVTEFRVWAPEARLVDVVVERRGPTVTRSLTPDEGVFSGVVPDVSPGARYGSRFDGGRPRCPTQRRDGSRVVLTSSRR
jgi:Carbohydrate-binding module 48 (Isoamylase N-terminal domain)